MSATASHRFRVAAVAFGSIIFALAPTSTAQSAVTEYAALGDSFASGVGTRTYYADSGSCYRSPKAYPVIDAARIGATLRFKACSGADTADILSGQLGTLGSGTDYVTIQVGGNDAGFSSVITTCAQPSWASNCNAAIDQAQAKIRNTLPGRLDNVYSTVDGLAPNAGVVVVGYPRLFNGEDCNAGTWFSTAEMTRLNATADLLNATIEGRADARSFAFVNPSNAYAGHAVCDSVEWVNGLSNPVRESYHPNVRGQAGYADLVDDALS